MGSSALINRSPASEDYKVKASFSDGTPAFLDTKVDGTTITVVGDQLVRAALTGDVTTVGNAATVVGGNADTVTTNANLTGDVTSVGNATTVVTNANLTGDVTSVGNATTVVTNANLTGDVTSVGNATTVVGGHADTVTTNANLTGDVTSVGNATTTVTNANLTGDVTSVGNATTVVTNANLTGDVTSVGNATTVVTNANLTGDVTSVGNATTLNITGQMPGYVPVYTGASWIAVPGAPNAGFQATCTGMTAIAIDTDVDVTFTVEQFDTGGNYASPSYTLPSDGKYLFTYTVVLDNIDANASLYSTRLSGTIGGQQAVYFDAGSMIETGRFTLTQTMLVSGSTGNTVKVLVRQDGGTSQTTIQGGDFSGFKIIGD